MDITSNFIQAQLELLAADGYRITPMATATDKDLKTYNCGKGKALGINALTGADSEKLYTAAEVVAMAKHLKYQNAQGYNIFVTPFSATYKYLLIDDVQFNELPEALQRPTLLLSSSLASQQAVYRLSADFFRSRKHFVSVFNEFNWLYGDKEISGAIHPFRLRGFVNRKLKYCSADGLYPYVKEISNNPGEQPDSLKELIQSIGGEDSLSFSGAERAEGISLPVAAATAQTLLNPGEQPTAYDIIFAQKWYLGAENMYKSRLDLSKVDFILAGKMLGFKKPAGVIAATLFRCSPDILKRHPDINDYVSKIVKSAIKHQLPI